MIDGENTILPILTFDSKTNWADLYRIAQPELETEGMRRLIAALHSTVKCIAVERHYIDKDYRDTFSNFHSKRFSTPSSRCLRFHFFDRPITREALKAGPDKQSYLGYAIIRPTKPNCIGRTLLVPSSRGPASAWASLCTEHVSILGTELDVVGFPFISQDADVTVCAQSAVWMLLRYFSNRYRVYPETYPFQVGNLTKDYSLGRIFPSSGLYVWQMAEALRRIGFGSVIYTRRRFPEFDHLLYTYIESGIPVLAGLKDHVVVAFGHRSNFSTAPSGSGPFFTSGYNDAFVINDDNAVPYQLLHKSAASGIGAHSSKYHFEDIVDFVVPLPDKVFLPAESFQTVVTTILEKSTDFGVATLSPMLRKSGLVLRLFLTTGKSFKKRLAERKMGHALVEDMYRNLPLPHFVWVCEISHSEVFSKHEIWGEILWDATRNACEPNGWIALHYPEILVVDTGSALNGSQELIKFDLQNSVTYPVYRNNLQAI
jgi:hypothetical protein